MDNRHASSYVRDCAAELPHGHRRHDENLACRRLCPRHRNGRDGKILRRCRGDANSHSYGNSYCHADSYIHRNTYCHGDGNAYTDCHADSHIHRNAYCHADSDTYTDSNPNSYSYSNSDGNWNSKRTPASYSNPAASA